jgi:hypothetical protein
MGDRKRGDRAAHAAAQLRWQRRACLLPSGARRAGRVQPPSRCRLVVGRVAQLLMINQEDIEKLASAARHLAPSASVYLEEDFVMNLLETVLDYMLQTEVVVKALERFRENRWNEVRTLDDLEQLMARFPADQAGNTALAQHLWGYNFWTRAQQLRELARYFRSIGVVDQEATQAVGAHEHVQERLRRPSQRARACRLPVAGDAPRRRHRQAGRSRQAFCGGGRRPQAQRSGRHRADNQRGPEHRDKGVRARLADLGGVPRRGDPLPRPTHLRDATR